jgi:hypothetical protein
MRGVERLLVVCLRSPILPTVWRRIAKQVRGIQPQIIPGDGLSRAARNGSLPTADILTWAKQRTFLFWSDTFMKEAVWLVNVAIGCGHNSETGASCLVD